MFIIKGYDCTLKCLTHGLLTCFFLFSFLFPSGFLLSTLPYFPLASPSSSFPLHSSLLLQSFLFRPLFLTTSISLHRPLFSFWHELSHFLLCFLLPRPYNASSSPLRHPPSPPPLFSLASILLLFVSASYYPGYTMFPCPHLLLLLILLRVYSCIKGECTAALH